MKAPDNIHDYGQRICMNCGKVFTAEKPWQVTCGDDCRKSRSKQLGRLRQRERTAKIANLTHDIGIMDAVLKETCSDFDKAELMMAAAGGLRYHEWKRPEGENRGQAETAESETPPEIIPEPAGLGPEPAGGHVFGTPEGHAEDEDRRHVPEPDPEPEKKPERKYCERMKCWADSLPCGEREECFLSPRCASVPEGVSKLSHRCEICGKPLENMKGGRRYCSPSCRMKASRRKQGGKDDRLWNASDVEENL